MDATFALSIGQKMLEVVTLISIPLMIPSLIAGLLVGMFQATTQINEASLSFVPKLAVVGVSLVVFGPWMLDTYVSFVTELIRSIPNHLG